VVESFQDEFQIFVRELWLRHIRNLDDPIGRCDLQQHFRTQRTTFPSMKLIVRFAFSPRWV
jgi:hypothetical protein